MLLKTSFLLRHLSCNVEFEFNWFHNTEQSSQILILKIEMLLEFQNKANIEVVGTKLKHSGFPSVSSDMDLGNIEFLDTHLDFLDTDILSNLLLLCKTSWRGLQHMSSKLLQGMSSRRLQEMSSRLLKDVFSVTIFHLPRHLAGCLQEVFKSLKMSLQDSSRRLRRKYCYAEDVLKTSSRHILKTSWRCLEDQQILAG